MTNIDGQRSPASKKTLTPQTPTSINPKNIPRGMFFHHPTLLYFSTMIIILLQVNYFFKQV